MAPKIWAVEKDDSIQCQQLTAEYLDEAVEMMEDAFLRHENVCRAVGLPQDPQGIYELKELTRSVAKDGVSIIAIDKTTNKVLGGAFNKLQVKDTSGEPPFFASFAKSCKSKRAIAVLDLMLEIDGLCNLFDLCKVDCLLEIMFLGTLPESRGKGIAKRLCEASIEVARDLMKGNDVKVAVDGQELGLEPVPKACSAIYTTFITQRIGRQLGFEIAAEKSYEELEYEGKSYASLIGTETPSLTLEYKKLILNHYLKMSKPVEATSPDGTIRYQLLTPKYLDSACEVVKATLFTSGNVSKAVGVPNDPQALAELDLLPRTTALYGISVIAIDTTRDQVVGVAFNKLHTPEDPQFEDLKKKFKNPKSRKILDFIISCETLCNIYEICQTDCYMELFLLGTLPEYRQKGIGKKLSEISINVARNLLEGINIKKSLDGKELSVEPRPKAVSAIFTSPISQRIGRELGFKIAAEKSKTVMGETLEKPVESSTTLEYLKLE